MSKYNLSQLDDDQLCRLVEQRWNSSSEIWDELNRVYNKNTRVYENKAEWLQFVPEVRRKYQVQANRIFVNMEAVINSLIANPPGINVLPSREGVEAQDFARKLERYFRNKYVDLNMKEIMRQGYRNLYFGRLLVIKPFWNDKINDFDFRALDPRKVRFSKFARNEQSSEFAGEEIDDNLCAIIERFPKKKAILMKKYGFANEAELYIKNPDVTYKEIYIADYVICKLENIILDKFKNPYWDWDGVLVTEDEQAQLDGNGTDQGLAGQARRDMLTQIKLQQDQRQQEQAQPPQPPVPSPYPAPQPTQPSPTGVPEAETPRETQVPQAPTPPKYKAYMFNYFDTPRKPYIFATIFNNENTPIGRTDMITLSAELQKGIDKRKMDIDENCELANGIIKVDANVMGKSDAQRIRFQTKGVIWGKGVKDGVTRETGQALPQMVFDDMLDSRSEIDNIMAASSAFRGEREGQETKAGRLALIQQSYLRLNELVQLGDYVAKECFDWGMQLAKTRYTEYHYSKWMGKEDATETMELIQDDFETGTEVVIRAGKTLPVDDEFKFEQAQNDVQQGFISPVDYLEIANYDNAKELAKNAVLYKLDPTTQINLTPEEQQKLPPPPPIETVSISYMDLPPDGQIQAAKLAGITLDPQLLIAQHVEQQKQQQADKQTQQQNDQTSQAMSFDAQKHGQKMSEQEMKIKEKMANKPKLTSNKK